ncbi:hypothetical protein C8A03DRAFT_19616 [Achaetomium macrosporum]|uniref:Ecp2 effector protein domain-containing protein n=1 Tax=Achaetomium macrosporum TaxID=79813 RepID=A0AAN7C1D7_9PEZI|nr:hypothetical protein C8A03DRAFT_19616 [Achaetomium macrosporum]
MRSAAVLLFAAFTGSAFSAPSQVARNEGYVIPDLGDGVFTASFGEHGLVNVTRISDIDYDAVPGVSARDGLAPRALPISRFGCYRASQNHNDWEIVRANFKNMCNQGVRIPGHGIRYAVSGVQVAFGCSWGGENACSGGEYDEFLAFINGNCGGWNGGWVDMDNWKKQYGMEQRGEAICGRSISWG